MNLGPYEVWGHFAPMFHLVDVFAVYAITLVGGRHVILPSFTPVDTLLTIGETASIAWRCQHPLGCGWERGVGRRLHAYTCRCPERSRKRSRRLDLTIGIPSPPLTLPSIA